MTLRERVATAREQYVRKGYCTTAVGLTPDHAVVAAAVRVADRPLVLACAGGFTTAQFAAHIAPCMMNTVHAMAAWLPQ